MLLSEHRKANMFKVKRLIEKGGISYRNHHLSRQFLTTACTFPFSCKNSSAEYIYVFYTCLCARARVCVCEWERERVWMSQCVCLLSMWLSLFVRMRHVDTSWICSAEEFLELYRNVEAVVRNCLLRWSGHLVEVVGTPLFDQSFCFKHISFFCAAIGAFSAGL